MMPNKKIKFAYCNANIPTDYTNCFDYFIIKNSPYHSISSLQGFIIYAVDSHAFQHPELHGIKNNFYHLLSLAYDFVFRQSKLTFKDIKFLQQRVNSNENIPKLLPPKNRGTININALDNEITIKDYKKFSKQWGEQVWVTWEKYHSFIKNEIYNLFNTKFI